MESKLNALVILVLGLYLLTMVGEGITYQRDKAHYDRQFKVDSATLVELRRYNTILEAQAERIARTPYIDKDSIGVGYDGYLFSKYHKEYKYKE